MRNVNVVHWQKSDGQDSVLAARGALDGSSASEIIHVLETSQNLQFPITLDFSALREINWFGMMVLSAGLSRICQSRGEVVIRNYGHFLNDGEESKMISALLVQLHLTI